MMSSLIHDCNLDSFIFFLPLQSTSNYAARRFGVRAAMPGFIARKLCPQLVIVPTNFKKYTATSMVCRKILLQYDPNMSPMSLDEAYIDFTNHMRERPNVSEESRTFPEYSEDLCRCEPEERKVSSSDGEKQTGERHLVRRTDNNFFYSVNNFNS